MKKAIIFLLVLIRLNSNDLFNENKDVANITCEPQFISLGGDCHTALPLRDYGFRNAAFPFDWMISTDHEGFITLLDEDFLYFFEKSHFAMGENGHSCHQYYHLRFVHDFEGFEWMNDPKMEEWKLFKSKYMRRIERFRSLREFSGKVYFVRSFWTRWNLQDVHEFHENTRRAREVKQALDRYFPGLNFTLVIVTYTDLDIPPMEKIDGVIEIRAEKHRNLYNLFMLLQAHPERF
jgi:hypothetical protein